MQWKIFVMLIAGILFCMASVSYMIVKIMLRPKPDDHLDDCYWEFEDRHPALVRYQIWSRRTLAAVIISMMLLFLCIAL